VTITLVINVHSKVNLKCTTMNNSTVSGKIPGFDHPYGATKIYDSKSDSSRRLKAAHMVGPKLDKLTHNKIAKKNGRKKKNKKLQRMMKMFVRQGCAPDRCCYRKDKLEKVSDNEPVALVDVIVSQTIICHQKFPVGGAPCLWRRKNIYSIQLGTESSPRGH